MTVNSDLQKHQRIQQFVNLCRRNVALYTIISTEPLVFFVTIRTNLLDFLHDYGLLFNFLKQRKAYFICSTETYFENLEDVKNLKKFIKNLIKKHPNFTFIFLANTCNQTRIFNENSLTAIFCSNNCFIDEQLFFPTPNTEKYFDAVYDARLVNWKRHDLAIKIKSLGLIYYAIPWSEDISYIDKIKKDFEYAHLFNHSESAKYKKMSPSEVNECLNQCRVGLCLSEVEGAMFASIQYLLAGLPVVTISSLGGRDEFFDDEISLTVETDPTSVSKGVKEMIERNISPHLIRQKTLERIKSHRQKFIELVQQIYDQENIKRNFSEEFKKMFFNKFIRKTNHNITIQLLTSQKFEQD